MLPLLHAVCASSPLRVTSAGWGDCFSSPCDYTFAVTRLADSQQVVFEDSTISIASHPSPLSGLFQAAILKNVTLTARTETTILGNSSITEPFFPVDPTINFSWGKVRGFTFQNFDTAVVLRTASETSWPLIIFENCSFVDNTVDVINVKGGTFQFDHCLFRNNSHRPLKIMSGTAAELTDCEVIDCNASFMYDCDLIIRNSRFINITGSRGGAIYLSKATFLIDGTKFIRNSARSVGGAIYIGETGADLASEVRRSCFLANAAPTNGTSVYLYYSDVTFREDCFSDSSAAAIVGFESNTAQTANIFDSACNECLASESPVDPFDPVQQGRGLSPDDDEL
jgi:hypothetical protein